MSCLPSPPGFVPLISLRRSLARKAFVNPVAQPHLRYRYAGEWRDQPPRVLLSGAGPAQLGIIIPTLTPNTGLGSLDRSLQRLACSLQRLLVTPTAPRCFAAIAMQDRSDVSRREAILEALEQTWAALNEGHQAVPLVGVSVSQPGKILALNCCLPLLDANAATCVAWFDDDVEVLPECLPALWQVFDPQFQGVYGAGKIAMPDQSSFSRFWARMKNRREPINRYPHGCAMLMSRQVFGDGIPLCYITDDHYYLFRLLDPAAANPLHLLRVVPDAVVHVPSVNRARVALSRTARNYRNVQRVLADVPPATIAYFLRELHFPGLRRPRSLHEACTLRYWRRLAVDAVKRGYWELLRGEIFVRGLLGWPRQTVWFSAPQPRSMVVRREQPGESR